MNPRVLEIIKNPAVLSQSDMSVLQSEIDRHPFAQSFRALHLIGVQRFNEGSFKNKLSEVAAYTADKKNLYKVLHPQEVSQVQEFMNENASNKIDVANVETIIANEMQNIDNVVNVDSSNKFETQQEIVAEENFSQEIIVDDKQPEPDLVENAADISFHGVDDFLPEVKFSVSNPPETAPPKQKSMSKADEEMQRLIAEVEARMKSKPAAKSIEPETHGNADLDFYENSAEISEAMQAAELEPLKMNENHPLDSWKPMTFSGEEVSKKIISEESFKNIEKSEDAAEESANETAKPAGDSGNVGQFINTWQNWLQLNKSKAEKAVAEEVPAEILDKKTAAIETFIENEPKISKLRKEEFTPAKKDRGENISHLMTETLAKIYAEQKLYAKAAEAYEVLKEKFPERSADFDREIGRIRELRQNLK